MAKKTVAKSDGFGGDGGLTLLEASAKGWTLEPPASAADKAADELEDRQHDAVADYEDYCNEASDKLGAALSRAMGGDKKSAVVFYVKAYKSALRKADASHKQVIALNAQDISFDEPADIARLHRLSHVADAIVEACSK